MAKITCKWCNKTVEVLDDCLDILTVCTQCLEDIVKALPEETRNSPYTTVIGLSGNRELPKC